MVFNGEPYDIYGERNYMSNYMIIICWKTNGDSMFNRQLTAINGELVLYGLLYGFNGVLNTMPNAEHGEIIICLIICWKTNGNSMFNRQLTAINGELVLYGLLYGF